jgi:hypothetical protein
MKGSGDDKINSGKGIDFNYGDSQSGDRSGDDKIDSGDETIPSSDNE